MEHDMSTMDHDMSAMGHDMSGMHEMAELAAASGIDYSLAMIAGFLGSGHCLGMCGALVSGYFMKAGKNQAYLAYLAYQLARISMYGLVGISAASLGVVLVSGGLFGKLQSIMQMLIGCVVIVLALGILGWLPWQASMRLLPMPLLRKGYAHAHQQGPILGAAMAGVLNGLMPCPLTFAMAVKATSAATPWQGGLLMLAFGAGTLPMMLFISVAFGKISARMRGLMMKAAALIMMLMGANTVHKGFMFFADANFKHSQFLLHVHDYLIRSIDFLTSALGYIAEMIRHIHGV
jgi:uncharacterized protein